MPWWGWIIVGTLLFASELFLDSGFYLVFLGASALIVGLAGLAGFEGELWEQWLAFAALSVLTLVFFRARLYQHYTHAEGTKDPLIGEVAVASESIAPGTTGAVELRGTRWQARNSGESALDPGTRARVEQVEGLMVHVRAEAEEQAQ